MLWVEEADLGHLQQAVAVHRIRSGDPGLRARLAAVVLAVEEIRRTTAANIVDGRGGGAHAQLMSHATAATALGCSTRTVRRRVATGRLTTVGRKITTASLASLLDSAPGSTRPSNPASLRRDQPSRRQPGVIVTRQGVAPVEPGAL